jgi:hypothetical protein
MNPEILEERRNQVRAYLEEHLKRLEADPRELIRKHLVTRHTVGWQISPELPESFTELEQREQNGERFVEVHTKFTNTSKIIESAQSDPIAFDALIEICTIWLRSDEPLPTNLRSWLAGYLDNTLRKPVLRRDKRKQHLQRLRIALAIALIADEQLKATRNDVSKTTSASDIVAEELIKMHMPFSFGSVKDIWKEYSYLR